MESKNKGIFGSDKERFDPGVDSTREVDSADHIYGKEPEDGNANKLVYYSSLEHKIVRYLLRNGNEFGEPLTDFAMLFDAGYMEIKETVEKSEKMELVDLASGFRARVIRSVVGWKE